MLIFVVSFWFRGIGSLESLVYAHMQTTLKADFIDHLPWGVQGKRKRESVCVWLFLSYKINWSRTQVEAE